MHDCSIQGKKALKGFLLLLTISIILLLKEYINTKFAIFYILLVLFFSLKWIIPYIFCIMESYNKLKK